MQRNKCFSINTQLEALRVCRWTEEFNLKKSLSISELRMSMQKGVIEMILSPDTINLDLRR
jgi:hypothetical protein